MRVFIPIIEKVSFNVKLAYNILTILNLGFLAKFSLTAGNWIAKLPW